MLIVHIRVIHDIQLDFLIIALLMAKNKVFSFTTFKNANTAIFNV